MDALIKNAVIVTASGTSPGDLAITDGRISEIGLNLNPASNCPCLDLGGAYLLPGGVDVHTHFDMDAGDFKTSDDFYTGTRAALAGGTTTIIDFAQAEAGAALQQGLNAWHAKADGRSFCDYGFHMTITHWNNGLPSEMAEMINEGVVSFKLYTACEGKRVDDDVLYLALKESKKLGGLALFHCENGSLINILSKEFLRSDPADIRNYPRSKPVLTEKEAVSRVIDIARLVEAPVYIVHLSAAASLEAVERQRKSGAQVIVETCPHYLLLKRNLYNLPDFEAAKFVMSPPLREKQDTEVLWAALASGQIQVVSTDHCSFNWGEQKRRGKGDFSQIPSGIPSVEHRMPLMFTYGVMEKRLSLSRYVELMATNPAKIFGLYPQKGEIKPGSDADFIVLKDTGADEQTLITAATQQQAVDYTPYEGFPLRCRISKVFLRGRCVVDEGNIVGEPGGLFLKRAPGFKAWEVI